MDKRYLPEDRKYYELGNDVDLNKAFERMGELLEISEFFRVVAICDDIINRGYEIPEFYQVMLMAESSVRSMNELSKASIPLDNCSSYMKAINLSDDKTASYIRKCNELVNNRVKNASNETPSFLRLNNESNNSSPESNNFFSSSNVKKHEYEIEKKKPSRNNKGKKGKPIIIVIIAILVLVILAICAILMINKKSNYYTNTRVEKLKTFSSFCGKEPASVDVQDTVTVYSYFLEPGADTMTAILQYEKYLSSDMGFSAEPNGDMTAYFRNDDLIMEWMDDSSGTMIEYYLAIPLDMSNEEIDAAISASTTTVSDLQKLNDSGEYEKVIELFGQNEWPDSIVEDARTEMLYAKSMYWYNNGLYGKALETLEERCKGIHNADSYISELHGKLDKYTGTYYYEVWPDSHSGQYLFIRDGLVELGFDSDAKKSELYYVSGSLASVKDANGSERIVIMDVTNMDYKIKYEFGSSSNDTAKYIQHANDTRDTFDGGPYKKINNNPPKNNQ